jgi:NitT/TauT family transport system permease protein
MEAQASRARQPGRALLTAPSRTAVLWLGRLAVPVLVLAGWAVAATSSDLVPSIGSSVRALADGFRDGWIGDPLWNTAQSVLGGFAIAAALAVPLGVLLGASRLVGSIFEPLINGLFAVPRIILYPVLLAMFGVGVAAKLWMAMLSAFFPIVMNVSAGVRDVNPTLVKLGRSVHCSRFGLVRKIYLPAATPTVMVGLRIGFSIAFIATIIAEIFASPTGLGRLIQRAYATQDFARMWGIVLLISVIAFAINLAMWSIERRLRSGGSR